ncbi:serine/threonine-protein kinase [Nocardia tenerifensis]|uniref:non-specific serine/threonine protein kinase n=1 Tax=Nocardia tenerifensis TaxID=228006 RepID=A0A318K4M4_9NOCA|nr:serine/threonine-protein kinase [Nocardia tenerifensis]PXX66360.1 serine/threonine-protein kinase [Nocardia tenerifensis]
MGETWFGHYRLDRLLGSGGTGQVWLAQDSIADRAVALKVLSATVAADPKYRQRFTREARLAAQVRGPHLAAIHEFGEIDDRLYLAMEYIEGTDLATVLRLEGPMSPARAVRVVMQVATALDAAHWAGLVHRDVKPANIMVDPNGHVHLIDFGTAYRIDQPAITTSSNVVGTLAYMAPERFSSSGDARSDQYSLACVLYECLTARRPFGNADAAQSMVAHLMTDPPLAADFNHAVPAALDAVIARGMAKVPEQRCASAGEFASAAYAAITGLDVPTVETSAAVLSATALPRPFRVAETRPLRTPDSLGAGSADSQGITRQDRLDEGDRARRLARSRVAVGALVALLVAVGLALWLGRPGDGRDSAASTFGPPTTHGGTSESRLAPPPATRTPEPVAPQTKPIATAPVVWQPCDPAVDGRGLAGDGTPLLCVGTVGRLANWVPAESNAEPPENTAKRDRGDFGGGNNGDGSGDANVNAPGNGNGSGPGNNNGNGPGNNNGNGHGKHGKDK